MRALDDLSGPWRGMSTQQGLRISEAIQLVFSNGSILGNGSDIDGIFVLHGRYSPDGHVAIVRRYTQTTAPNSEGVGTPYDYDGFWDGSFVAGHWSQRDLRWNGGPFEMWPESEEDLKALAIETQAIHAPDPVTAMR